MKSASKVYMMENNEEKSNSDIQNNILERKDIDKLIYENKDFVMNFIKKKAWDKQSVQDIFQSTMLETLKAYQNFRGGSQPRTWMCGIALNMIKVHAKKNSSAKTVYIDDLDESPIGNAMSNQGCEDPYNFCEKEEWMKKALVAFDRLPEEMRVTFNEVVSVGRTYEQTANLLGVPIGTVRSRVARARDILRSAVV